jgi:hypothetical protein
VWGNAWRVFNAAIPPVPNPDSTKRVAAPAASGITKMMLSAPTAVHTKKITAPITSNITESFSTSALVSPTTKRVASTGGNPLNTYYAWGRSWGGAGTAGRVWGDSWNVFLPAIEAAPLPDTTKRINAAATSSITKMIPTVVGVSYTKRVASKGTSDAAAAFFGNSAWGRSWGGFVSAAPVGDIDDSWGDVWKTATAAVPGTGEAPAVDTTKRVTGPVQDPV